MTNHKRLATIIAATIAVGAAGPAEAKVPTAHFSVTLKGKQETLWSTQEETITDGCGSRVTSGGFETVQFRSARPAALRVVEDRKRLRADFGSPTTDLTGTVSRQSTNDNAFVGDCFGGEDVAQGDGSGVEDEPPVPDQGCGKVAFKDLTVALDFEHRIGWVELGEDTFTPLDPMPDCDVEGPAFFPTLLSTSGRKRIRSEIPYRDLLNRRIGKHIVLGGGRETRALPGGEARTSIQWELVLRRVKAPRR